MSKIIFFEAENWEEGILKKTFQDIELVKEPLSEKNVKEFASAEIISIFIYSKLTKDILEKMPHLKFIATRSTGFDHIDTKYCKTKHIEVSNVPSYGVHTVAEQTFALILSLTRKIILCVDRTKKGDFSIDGLEGIDLNGKTLGVIGAGKIGTTVMQIGISFGMHILALSHHHQISDNPSIQFVDLDTLLKKSDIVTLHLPLTPETKHFIHKENIKKFKKGAYLINTARGGLIETEALMEGLEKGILAGVGLDVLEGEMDIKEERELLSSEFLKTGDVKIELLNHMLMQKDNVLITPHNAFHTKEAVREILDTTIDNIHFFQERKPQNLIEGS